MKAGVLREGIQESTRLSLFQEHSVTVDMGCNLLDACCHYKEYRLCSRIDRDAEQPGQEIITIPC
jgi:hypothetical protein